MSIRKYNDKSDVLYFNPVDVQEIDSTDKRFETYVNAFVYMKEFSDKEKTAGTETGDITKTVLYDIKDTSKECKVIRQFRRLTISPGFMYANYDFIVSEREDTTIDRVFKYCIDRQHEMCMNTLGYGFVNYAPAMAFLFTYKGYTYEKFKRLAPEGIWGRQINEHTDKIYDIFLYIKKQQDIREYLIALHYNRELRYYAENPTEEIEEESILNEFITHNIAILIRMLWNDFNKFVIVAERLLKRKKLSNCTLSMLLYILAYQKAIYAPIRDKLQKELLLKSAESLGRKIVADDQYAMINLETADEERIWKVSGNNSEKLIQFIDLSLNHTIEIFRFLDADNSDELVKSLIKNNAFRIYNRQYQMLYYGDLTMHGEDRKRALIPGTDTVNKGFDFHNCFNFLCFKINLDVPYALREFDTFTLCDLIASRINVEKERAATGIDTFFNRRSFNEKAKKVLSQIITILDRYLENHPEAQDEVKKYFEIQRDFFNKELEFRQNSVASD